MNYIIFILKKIDNKSHYKIYEYSDSFATYEEAMEAALKESLKLI